MAHDIRETLRGHVAVRRHGRGDPGWYDRLVCSACHEVLADYRAAEGYRGPDAPLPHVVPGRCEAMLALAALEEQDREMERLRGEAGGDVGARAYIARLAREHKAEEPTVPDRGGGVPGDLYEL